MRKITKLLLVSALSANMLWVPASIAKVPADKQAEVQERKKARGGKALGPRVGKKVQTAFELYGEEKLTEALDLLLDIETSNKFDKAFIDRYIGSMYASIDGKTDVAIKHLLDSYKANQLPFDDHAGVIKLIADLSLQEKQYERAVKFYKEYLTFSLDEDANTYLRMANAFYELKQYDAVITPAKRAIALFDKPNQNPYILIMASYYDRKMYKQTVTAVENLVKAFPKEGKWWRQLGMFYMMVEDYERGLSTLEVAYNQGYLEKENHFKQLAQLYATNGIPYKAAIIQEKYINNGIIKKNVQSLTTMANTFQNAKEYAKAAKYFGEAAVIENDADLYRRQGNVLMGVEDYKGAVVAYEKALAAGIKTKGKVYMGIAESNFYLEKWHQAYAAVLEAKKDKATVRNAKGWEGYIKDKASRNGVRL